MTWNDHGYFKDSLDGRFVPAWEATARVQGFKLCRDHDFTLAFNVLITGAVEAGHLIVVTALELDVEESHTYVCERGRLEAHRQEQLLTTETER